MILVLVAYFSIDVVSILLGILEEGDEEELETNSYGICIFNLSLYIIFTECL